METTHHHGHHHHEHQEHKPSIFQSENFLGLAFSATLHCLLGCGIGEVVGMIISTYIGLSMINSMILSILLGFVAGLGLGIIPLLKKKFTFQNAIKTVILAEGLSIVVMEAFEVVTQLMIPNLMTATLTDRIFWIGMLISLLVGFIAALPVNYVMIKKGVRHIH